MSTQQLQNGYLLFLFVIHRIHLVDVLPFMHHFITLAGIGP